ncbi:MAG: right-handed parallel beta-helix repeat-containing protein [Armatimonadetes bacterium]|nr:right-handed parallel beta-helix repeat-containing protein [Armatimonadota bacterium]
MRFFACLLLALPSLAFATDVFGDVSGVWDEVHSPYNMVGDVHVPAGQTLDIGPGVQVVSQGFYKLTVDGTLHAAGSQAKPILFTAANHTTGWRGVRLLTAGPTSSVAYSVFEYAKGTGAWPEVQGGGLIVRTCSPTVSHCTFRFNLSQNSNFNGVGAGLLLSQSDSVVSDCQFLSNTCDSGAGVCVMDSGSPTIQRCLFDSNSSRYAGGGAYLGAGTSPTLDANRFFRNNSGGYGGGAINSWTSFLLYNTKPTITNNLIAHNSAATGGGIYCRYDRADIFNNTIVNNIGHGIFALNQGQPVYIGNCILWGNTAAQIGLEGSTGSVVNVFCSDVQGGWGGTGNINANPHFVNATADNYRLGFGSPCIDSGNNSSVLGPFDIELRPRKVDDPKQRDTGFGGSPVVDMGAYERSAVTKGGPGTLVGP